MNALLLEITASIGAAGVLGLVVGWMIRSTSARHTLMQQRIRNQLLQAEAILDKQNEIDQLIDQIAAGDAERDDLTRANQSLEAALRQLEQEALRQRSAATAQRLRNYDAAAPAVGGRPNTIDWQAELADDTLVLETRLEDPGESSCIDATVMLTEAIDEDATLALEDPLGAASGSDDAAEAFPDKPAAPVSGLIKRELPDTPTARSVANSR